MSTIDPASSIHEVENRIATLESQLFCLTPQVLTAINELHLLKESLRKLKKKT